MRKLTAFLTVVYLVYVLFLHSSVYSQCSLYEVPLQERIDFSDLIIEGRVIAQKSFWNPTSDMIYTSNEVEIFKVFKGTTSSNTITVITIGGQVKQDRITVSSLLKLAKEEIGIFMLKEHSFDFLVNNTEVYSVFSSAQGVIKYDFLIQEASDIFNHYSNLDQLYAIIEKETGSNYIRIKDIKSENRSANFNSSVLSISFFSPVELSAGTKSRLNILGSGFGNSPKVLFREADYGGTKFIEALESQYVVRSESQIIVEVPSGAGSGTFKVNNGGFETNSLSPINILFSTYNVIDGDEAFLPKLINHSGGGYVFEMYSEFESNANVKDAFIRSLTRWRCESYMNWTLGKVSSNNQSVRDNANVIRFEKGQVLGAGVLGLCYSHFTSCGDGNWYVAEKDIVFNKDVNWNFSPGNPFNSQFDFETIVLHELGHGHQLDHVINNNDLMHYNIGPGKQKRDLNDNNRAGAKIVLDRSILGEICEKKPLMSLNPEVCDNASLGFFDFSGLESNPNPFDSKLRISYQLSKESVVRMEVFDLFGKKVALLLNATKGVGRHFVDLNSAEFQLDAGVYFVRIHFGDTYSTQKVIKVHL